MTDSVDATATTRPDDETEIRRVIDLAVRHQSDPDEFVPLHASEAIIVNIAGRRVLGRDAIDDAVRAALTTSLAQVLTTVDIHDIRFVRPDVAMVSCTKHVSDERGQLSETDDDAALPPAGSLTYVMVREAGTWRIALAQTTPIKTA